MESLRLGREGGKIDDVSMSEMWFMKFNSYTFMGISKLVVSTEANPSMYGADPNRVNPFAVQHTLVMTVLFQWVLSWSGPGLAGSAAGKGGEKSHCTDIHVGQTPETYLGN